MKFLTFPITADHIARGKRSDASSCPIALALRDATNSPWSYYEGGDRAETDTELFRATNRARRFAKDFDRGEHVQPTRMRFEIINSWRDEDAD